MFLRLLLIVMYSCLAFSKVQPIPLDKLLALESLSRCLTTCMDTYFEDEYITYYLATGSDDPVVGLAEFILPMLQKNNRLYVMNPMKEIVKDHSFAKLGVSIFVLHFSTLSDLVRQIDHVRNSDALRTRSKFLMVSTTLFREPKQLVESIVENLWKTRVVETVTMVPNPKNPMEFLVTSWYALRNNDCVNVFDASTFVYNKCVSGTFQSPIDEPKWFRNLRRIRFNNCLIRVGYVNQPPFVIAYDNGQRPDGLEARLVQTVGEKLNLKLSYVKIDVNARTDKYEGAFELVMKGDIDVAIGAFSLNAEAGYLSYSLSYSHRYFTDAVVWCLPSTPLDSTVGNFLKSAHMNVQAPVLAISILCAVLISLLLKRRQSYRKWILHSFAVLGGIPVYNLPTSHRARIILGFMVTFGALYSVIQNCILLTVLTKPTFTEKYPDVKSVYTHDLDTYFTKEDLFFYDTVGEFEGVPFTKIEGKMRTCPRNEECLLDVALIQRSTMCISRAKLKFLVNKTIADGIHCLRKPKSPYYLVLLASRNHPILMSVDDVIDNIASAGFVNKWYKDVTLRLRRFETKQFSVMISLGRLAPIFYIYLMLLAVACCVFVVELCIDKRVRGRKNISNLTRNI